MNLGSHYNSKKQNLSQSNNFYQALVEKYQAPKQVEKSCKQSRGRCNSKVSKIKGNKNIEIKQQKNLHNKNILLVPHSWSGQQVGQILQNYSLDEVISEADKLGDIVMAGVLAENPKFVSLCVGQNSHGKQELNSRATKSGTMQSLIQPLARLFEKATICIYSMTDERKSRNEYYDMLSIRREIKTDLKLLVQTNICNNSKSGVILRKLVDVAKEREKLIMQETLIKVVVIKLKGVISVTNHPPKEVQIQLSAGGYGEIGNRDLMGAEKLRLYYNLIEVSEQEEFESVKDSISTFKKKQKQKALKESQLMEKIKHLQTELMEKKKQLEEQKQRAANDEAIEAQLDDIVLPSERPMVNIDKYETRLKVGSTKGGFRVAKIQ